MQDYVNLIYREEEREMLPLCAAEVIGVIPWSPLARGRLTRPWGTETARTETDEFGKTLYKDDAADKAIVEAVAQVADKRGITRAQVATAWVLQKSVVTAPIIGATKPSHLDDAIAAVDLVLTAEEIATLEAPYQPKRVTGFQ
jgi:aryl-alcohol dehydrogenase-like predicted oxidoreductase